MEAGWGSGEGAVQAGGAGRAGGALGAVQGPGEGRAGGPGGSRSVQARAGGRG